ncbi:GPI mannosyltransferase 3 [Papilio machaon]|uniref:GPI mannosyltransferase 3 n=1 Tax=Papilio machaon TaxID=76193 RepID=UPI001E664DC9|nr:GPI mannosyltransferase 3 [Papilio machaon]XP_045539566.1 GPI mannosyltransferase 3 [Papilio machaon]
MAAARGLKTLQVVALILFVRILSVLFVQTWYVPDEYWQSLEVAHKQVFGYGALTWEWQKGIRSYLYPSLFAALYAVLKFTGLDSPEAVVLVPRLFQAVISTAADYSFYKWTGGRKWALFLILTPSFWFYTSGRTLLQTMETCLVAIALSVYPFKDGALARYEKENNKWVWLACISTFLRPTSAPIWLVLALYNINTTNQGKLKLLAGTYLPIGLMVGGSLVALDTYFYGKLIITPLEFFKYNVLHNVASFYGTHPWYWYLTTGLPAVLGINTIPVAWAIYNVLRRRQENKTGMLLLLAAVLHVIVHSFIPHKEFRFVLPLLPILLYLAQNVIVPWSRKAKAWKLYLVATVLLLGNAVPAIYLGQTHQKGTVQVMPLLREAIGSNNKSSILFMMPCHSTPLYSHLHLNITTRYLHCDPPSPGETYESEAFYNNPQRWWRQEYSARHTPSLIVMFDVLRGRVENLLQGYKLIYEVPHTQYPEGEVGEKVLVFQKNVQVKQTDEAI